MAETGRRYLIFSTKFFFGYGKTFHDKRIKVNLEKFYLYNLQIAMDNPFFSGKYTWDAGKPTIEISHFFKILRAVFLPCQNILQKI